MYNISVFHNGVECIGADCENFCLSYCQNGNVQTKIGMDNINPEVMEQYGKVSGKACEVIHNIYSVDVPSLDDKTEE